MAEPLKNNLNTKYLQTLTKALQKSCSRLDTDLFLKACLRKDWKELELKQRISRISEAIHESLPGPYSENLNWLWDVAPQFGGFEALYFPEYVEKFGLDKAHRKESLKALAHFTQFSSAEFAVRPFILESPKTMMDWMLKLSRHKNYHLRRLASEGCRPRLPWAQALSDFKKDPGPILPILENLKEDSELYVRKSVANNLNDISKDNPDLALKLAKSWSRSSNPHTQWIINHGLRTLIKAGSPEAMKILGFNPKSAVTLTQFKLNPKKVALGESLKFSFKIKNPTGKPQSCLVDYIVFHRKKNGCLQPKVFKLKKLILKPGEQILVEKLHKLQKINTRTYYSGQHFLQIQLNGRPMDKGAFQLKTETLD